MPLPDVPPEVAANLLGALGNGEGALLLNTLSRAGKTNVDQMQAAGHPEAHPEKLRVGKLLAAIRNGDRPNLNWNSLPAWAVPEVLADSDPELVKIAIDERLIASPKEWDLLPATLREKPELLIMAIESGWLETPGQWNSLPADVREHPGVLHARGQRKAVDELVAEIQGEDPRPRINDIDWDSLPARAWVEVFRVAMEMELISTPEQWDSLPAAVRERPHKRRGIMPLPDVPPEVAANLVGALGNGEGAVLLNMLSRAGKKNVAEMQAAGQPEVHPEKLRVGKLLAAMRDGDHRPNWNWNSLPAWAVPEVAKVAIEERRISTPDQWDSVPDAAREKPEVVKLAIQKHLLNRSPRRGWNSLSLPAAVLANPDPEVVKLAIDEGLISTPEWDLLPATVREKPDVVIVAMESGLLRARHWNSLPADVREHPGVLQALGQREAVDDLVAAMQAKVFTGEVDLRPRVNDIDWDSLPARAWPELLQAAIANRLISTPEQWDSLPAAVREKPEVVIEAVSYLPCYPPPLLKTRKQWNSLPADVRENPVVVRAALSGCGRPYNSRYSCYDLISTPEQYLEVPADVRSRGDVADLALYCKLLEWDQAPAELHNDVEAVANAIFREVIWTRADENWNSLPAKVREHPLVEAAMRDQDEEYS
eukprot:g18755.t1